VVPLPAGKLEFPLAAVDGGRHGDVNVGRGQAEGELVGSGGVWVWEIPRGRVEGAADVVDLVSRLKVIEGGCFYHLVALCYAAAAVQVGRQLVHRCFESFRHDKIRCLREEMKNSGELSCD